MNAETKIKAVAAGVTVSLFASLIGTGILYRDNALLSEDIKAEKVRSESLAAEKVSLKNEMDRFKAELASMTLKNGDLSKAAREAQEKLSKHEARIAQLSKENNAIPALRKEAEAIRKIRQELVAQLEGMKAENSRMQMENAELNQTLAALRKENDRLSTMVNTKPTMAYNFLVEVMKKRQDKLTVRAKRTHKVDISFDVNNTSKLAGEYWIKVRNSKGSEVAGDMLLTSSEDYSSTSSELWAAANAEIVAPVEYQRVNLSFDPANKLEEGLYQVTVYNGNEYLGTTQFKLR